MEELRFFTGLIILGILFIGLDVWLYYLNKRLREGWERLRDETQKDQKDVEGLILKNIEILNEIHRVRNEQTLHQGIISNKNFIRAHRSLFERMGYDDFSDFLTELIFIRKKENELCLYRKLYSPHRFNNIISSLTGR